MGEQDAIRLHTTADRWRVAYDPKTRRGTVQYPARPVVWFHVDDNGHAVFKTADKVPGATIHAVQVWLDS